MKVIQNDIIKKQFKPVYIISGDETYLSKQFTERLCNAITNGDTINFNKFVEKADIKEIIALAETMPFFAENRLILIENCGLFKKDSSELADYLEKMPETTHIILREDDIDKRNKLYKKIKTIGYHAEMNRQSEENLEKWILILLSKENIKITGNALIHFLETVGNDMNVIKNELDKLISYVDDKKIIDISDIDTICTKQISNQIFDMIDAMSSHNRKKAFDLYEDLIALKEPHLRILYLIAKQYLQLFKIYELSKAGKNDKEISTCIGLNYYVVKKLRKKLSDFDNEKLKNCIEQCALYEEQIKTGIIKDNIAVELLITSLSR